MSVHQSFYPLELVPVQRNGPGSPIYITPSTPGDFQRDVTVQRPNPLHCWQSGQMAFSQSAVADPVAGKGGGHET